MKYEEIKIGDVFTYQSHEETVISKDDKYRVITTIDEDLRPTAWKENELYLLKSIIELPEEGLLVSGKGSLVYKLSDNSGYGFTFGNQSSYLFNNAWEFSVDGYWRKATEQEEKDFIEMLKNECEKKGLHENTKIENHANGHSSNLNVNHFKTSSSDATAIYNKHGQIFYKGKFATPIKDEEPTLELVSKAYLDLSKFGVEIKQEGNMLIIKPIKKT